ncbi:MAG: hypothetical protein Q9227_004180 [Pyrenula ochraceoflavens]
MIGILKGSEMLQEINDQFAPLMKQFRVFNFWEEMETSFGNFKTYLVDKDSAAPVWDNVERCGIARSHSRMTKYRHRHDDGYPVVLEALLRYSRLASPLIKSRWDNDQKIIAAERQREAEALLQVPMPLSMSEESLNDDTNECYWGVFWIDASNEENAESCFASLGQQAGKGANFAAGIHWLSKASRPWLLVLDNADDPEIDVTRFFPSGGNGHIIITTRNPNVTTHATAGQCRFTGMDPNEGVALLLKAAYPDPEPGDYSPRKHDLASSIASELGYLALALANAGATIRRNIYTLEKYLHYYLGCRKRMMIYSSIKSVDETNIITTWEIPFRQILNKRSLEHKDAGQLMHIFAFLHFETIPESIFRRSWIGNKEQQSRRERSPEIIGMGSVWNEEVEVRFRRAIQVLRDYSIIDYDPDKASCSFHPVVHGWARDRLTEHEQRHWLSYTSSILANCVSPFMEASGQGFRRLLLSHLDSCLRALKARYSSLPESLNQATVLERFSWVYAENGLWKRARSLQVLVVDYRMKVLGKRHETTLQAQRQLSSTLWNLFEIRQAAEMQKEVLLSRFWTRPSFSDWLIWPPWKPDHVSYCLALDDLTRTLWLAGRRELSRHCGQRAVRGFTRRCGMHDPQTLNAMFNLGRTYLHLGDQQRSHELLVRVLRSQKRFFGMDHPDTLMTRNEIGMSLCFSKRHLAAAEKLVINVLQTRRETLGEEHAYTLWSMNDLSKVYCERGRAKEATELLRGSVLPVAIRTLGEEHVGVVMTRANLARACVLYREWKEAEKTILTMLPLMSPDHPDWIHTMSGYVQVRIHLGQFDDAEKDGLKLLDMIESTKVFPMDNPRTIKIAEQLFTIYRAQGRLEKIAEVKTRVPGAEVEEGMMPFAVLPLGRQPGEATSPATP